MITEAISTDGWIQTITGRKFHYIGGEPDEVCIEDIATVLARMPRFAGHTTEFYSVAQHSVYVSYLVEERSNNAQEQLLGLLHDATEAYVCDIPKPLKRLLPDFSRIEHGIWEKISRRFLGGIVDLTLLVKECDGAMLAAEARDLFAYAPLDDWTKRCPPPPEAKVVPWTEAISYRRFMERFEELE